MANINEILARAAALRDETALNSISPERAGGIMYDTLLALNELWLQQGAALVISKIYASVAAMEADTAPVSDLTGKPLRPGQIVVIASSDSDNGSVYRYNGTESPSWSLVGSIGNLDPVDGLDSDSTTLPLAAHQGKVLDGKISQLGQNVGIAKVFNGSLGNWVDPKTCHTCMVPTFGAKYAYINTTRKPHSGYHYVFAADITDSGNDLGKGERMNTLTGNITHINESYFPASTYIDLSNVQNAVGISVRMFEVSDAATSMQTLDLQNISAADFEGEVFQIICTNAIPQLVEKAIKEKAVNPLTELLSDSLYESSYKQPVEYEIGGISFSSSGWSYGNSPFNIRSKQGLELHLHKGDVIGLTDYTGFHFDFGARLIDGTYISNTNLSNDYTVEREGYYVICTRQLNSYSIDSPENLSNLIKVIRNNTITTNLNGIENRLGILGVQLCDIYNGSIGNPGSTEYVHTQVVPLSGKNSCSLTIKRPNANNSKYVIGYALTSSVNDIGRFDRGYDWSGLLISTNPNPADDSLIIDLSAYPTAVGVAFTIAEWNGTSFNSLRYTDFADYITFAFSSKIIDDEIERIISSLEIDGYDSWDKNVLWRNGEREIALAAMCRYNIESSPIKDIQFCVASDSHGDNVALKNAVVVTNGFKTIDGMIHAGDIMPSYVDTNAVALFQNIIAQSEKPVYIVIGNHDVGNCKCPVLCCNSEQAYNFYIKQMVDNGWLASGEYQAGVPYWFHDDATYKVRIIGLCEYEAPMDIADSDYWEPVEYDATKPNMTLNTAYVVGDIRNCNYANAGIYTAYSFRCKANVTTPNNWYVEDGTLPNFKIHRGYRVIMQTQAQWFLDKLASTPENYGVVIVMHQAYSSVAPTVNCKFNDIEPKPNIQTCMETDFINNALTAFINGSNYSENVAMKGDAAYLNTQGGGTYAYSVSKNFAVKNSGVHLFGIVGGHSHRDIVLKNAGIYQINVISTNSSPNINNSKLCRSYGNDVNDVIRDSLTVISFRAERNQWYPKGIGLAKIGVNVTYDGTPRDYEVLGFTE